jgi:DHA2 family multidrug resistance protein
LVDHLTPDDTGTIQALDGLTGRLAIHGLPPGVAEQGALQLLDGVVGRQATMMAYNNVFWMMAMMFVITFPFLLLLGGRRSPAPRESLGLPTVNRTVLLNASVPL